MLKWHVEKMNLKLPSREPFALDDDHSVPRNSTNIIRYSLKINRLPIRYFAL